MSEKRGGRGEALRRLLELERAKEISTPGIQQNGIPHEVARPKPGGRALMLKLLQEGSKSPASASTPASSNTQAESLSNLTIASTSSRENGENVPVIKRGMSKLSIASQSSQESEKKEPVIQRGTSGIKVPLACNYIKLKVAEGKGFFQYRVTFTPEIDSRDLARYFVRQISDVIGNVKTFDGAILYLPHLLPDKVTTVVKEMPTELSKVTITITFTKEMEMGHRESIHLYNLLFRKIQNDLGFVLHGDSYYNPRSPIEIPAQKLLIWPGYVTTVQDFEGGVMLCCDVSHRVLHERTVYEWINEVRDRTKNKVDWGNCFKKSMIFQNVLTRYNNKVYRIDDVDLDSSPLSTFEKSKKLITYKEYYKQQYNIEIKDLEQPLLISRVKVRRDGKPDTMNVKLIPELCHLSGLTDEVRKNFAAMKGIAESTRVSPAQRVKSLENFINNINSNQNIKKILDDWGLSLDSKCIELKGRVLPMEPVITFGEKTPRVGSADWTSHLTQNPILKAIEFKDWICICTINDQRMVKDFLDTCKIVSPQMGLSYGNPKIVTIPRDNAEFILKTLDKYNNCVNFIVLVLTSARTDVYNMFKQFCNVTNAIPSQVILGRTIKNPRKHRAIAQKVLLQINCKLGGTLWTMKNHVNNTMVVGMDTYHDPSRKNPSVGALVASYDSKLTQWCSRAYIQDASIELGNKLEMNFLSVLEHYNNVNGSYPSQIIIYRDGVSDGQFDVCKEFEVSQFFSAIKRVSIEYEPKLIFVIVQKRINTRMFSCSASSIGNPVPGTVLDHTVNKKYLYDFYLASQSVKQGTATPTHYVVLFNNTKLDPDKVQKFSFMMTFLYYNWFGTIRVPAPCLYAHKLAAHVGENLGKTPNARLGDKLFFL